MIAGKLEVATMACVCFAVRRILSLLGQVLLYMNATLFTLPLRYILGFNYSHDPLHLSWPSRNKCNSFAKHLIQTSCLHQPLLCFVVSFFWILWYFTAVAGFPVQLVIRNLLLLQVFYVLSGFKWSVNIKLQFDTLHREIHSWHCFA